MMYWRVRMGGGKDRSLKHYGILGMKWGVRRTPEELGHRPTKSENKQRRKLNSDLSAAQKYVKMRTRMNDVNQDEANAADNQYQKALSKTVLPWNRSKKEAAVTEADARLEKAMKNLQETRWKMDRALNIGVEKEKALTGYVDALTEKYGKENVKQLKSTYMNAGKNFVVETVKTGFTADKLPVIGNMISAKKINQWEREIRDEIASKSSESSQKKRYA